MRCAISTEDTDPDSLASRVREHPGMEGADLAKNVSTKEIYDAAGLVGPPSSDHGPVLRVAAYDFGIKRNILRLLAQHGCDTTVFPAETPASEILAGDYHGVFLSNGPGDPAATKYGIESTKQLLGKLPIFGICLGSQLLGLALGGTTYKLKFGHRGANQPVLNLDTGIVEVTSHNHGFAVDPASFGETNGGQSRDEAGVVSRSWYGGVQGAERDHPGPNPETIFGPIQLTHWNLNDGTLEGLRCKDVPAFSVQYHPEAAPGPHDARYLFTSFRELMAGA
jgi:carbamoyl-phosphate synthase small subunit